MIYRWELGNGAKLVVEDIPYVKSAAVGMYIKVGSRYESARLAGVSHFIEHMLFKGTPERTARDIAESMESMGGQLNAYTAKEHTCFYARTLDEDIYTAIDIISDMVFNSLMTNNDFGVERQVIIEEINMYEDTPDELIHDVFARKFWEGHAMGNSILGSTQTIGSMEREELVDFYRAAYVPGNMIIAVAGNIDPLKIKDYLENKLDGYGGPVPVQSCDKPGFNQPFIKMIPKDVEQLQICLGVPSISYHDEKRFTQNVMNSILGGGMSSRLFQKLREELGLAYSVFSSPASYSDTGLFSIYIGTSAAHIDKFSRNLYEQIQLFIEQGVTEEEVRRTQKLMKSSLALGLEGVMNRMTRTGRAVLMYDQIMTPEEVIDRIYAVNASMIKDLANQIFDRQQFSIAAIGSNAVLPEVEQELARWWGNLA
ncbi:MAG: pitrilysin family protein [Syntrophomonas sp.]|nr:pitrilysin family protein [Syntrophomonas sp.]